MAAHSELEIEIAAALSKVSARGRPWQVGGLQLFEWGLPVSERALRECALWLFERTSKPAAELWREAAAQIVPLPGLGPSDLLGDIGALAADLARRQPATRAMLREVETEFRELLAYSDKAEASAAAHEALGLRLSLLAGGPPLPPDLDDLARYGRNGPPPDRGFPLALPHERNACAATLTLREAVVMGRLNRAFLALQPVKHLEEMWLLHLAVLDLASHRMGNPPYDPERPLSGEAIRDLERRAADAEAEVEAVEVDAPSA